MEEEHLVLQPRRQQQIVVRSTSLTGSYHPYMVAGRKELIVLLLLVRHFLCLLNGYFFSQPQHILRKTPARVLQVYIIRACLGFLT